LRNSLFLDPKTLKDVLSMTMTAPQLFAAEAALLSLARPLCKDEVEARAHVYLPSAGTAPAFVATAGGREMFV
jgi:hypothetical protein